MSRTGRLLLLVFTYMVWGAGYTVVKDGINQIPMEVFQLYRYLIAIIVLYVCFRKKINSLFQKFKWKQSLLLGFFSFASAYTAIIGISMTTASKAAFIIGTSVIILPFMQFIHFKTKLKLSHFVSMIICMIGIIFVTRIWEADFLWSDLILLVAAVLYNYQFLIMKSYSRVYGSESTTFMICLTIFIGFLILFLTQNHSDLYNAAKLISINEPILWIHLLFSGIIITALATYLEAFVVQTININVVVIISSLEPVFTLISEWILYQQSMSISQITGGLLIVFSTVLCGIEINKSHSKNIALEKP